MQTISAAINVASPDQSRCPLADDGTWCQILRQTLPGSFALFLDRDGVVVEEVGYLSRADDVALIPGAAAVVAAANARNIPVVLVTNQAGIGRGYFGWEDFAVVQETIVARLADSGAQLDAVYACPHHPQGQAGFVHADHPARKPNPGMMLRAAAELGIALDRSWLVGDKIIDIEAARRARLAGALHVLTGHGQVERAGVVPLTAPGFGLHLGTSIIGALGLPIFEGR